MKVFNKKLIEKNFSHNYLYYDDYALIQKISVNRILLHAKKINHCNKKILDIGSGTSLICRNLIDRKIINFDSSQYYEIDLSAQMLNFYKNKYINKINLDFEENKFESNYFDIIYSSFSLQWMNDVEKTFLEINRILKNGGLAIISMPVQGSIFELIDSNVKLGNKFNFNNFLCHDEVTNIVNKYFLIYKNYCIKYKLKYDSLRSIFDSIKRVGAGYSESKEENQKKISQKKITSEFYKKYTSYYTENYEFGDKLILSWNCNFLVLEKKNV